MEELFEKISRNKIRFNTDRGLVTAEDLWDLPLTSATGKPNLDDIAKGLHHQIKSQQDEVSFVDPVERTSSNLAEIAFAAVKRVIEIKVTERNAAREEKERKEKKQRILEIIAKKQDEALSGASLEELQKMAEGL